MTTVGQILNQARSHKKLTLEQVEKATKIRLKFLVALEKDEFDKLPPGTFAKGFIKNYAAYLGLPVEETMAFYRRQVNEEKTAVPGNSNPKPGSSFIPKMTFTTIAMIVLVAGFFIYLCYSYLRYAGSPTLLIASPNNNSVVKIDQLEVAGKTDPDAKLVINNQPVTVNENGSFNVNLSLQPGLNTLTIVSTNRFNRQTTLVRSVRLER